MDVVDQAPRLLAGLFDDGGRAVLHHGGLGASWAEALAHVPVEVLQVEPGADAGQRQLVRLRDFWARRRDWRPAVAATRGLMAWHVAQHGPDHPQTWLQRAMLGHLVVRAGRVTEGRALLHDAWAALQQASLPAARQGAVAAWLAGAYVATGDWSSAEPLLAEALRRVGPRGPGAWSRIAAQLGEVHLRLGRIDVAGPMLEDAWRFTVAEHGRHSAAAVTLAELLARARMELGDPQGASELLRQVLTAVAAAHGDDAERMAGLRFTLGLALARAGQSEEGLRNVDEALRWTRSARGRKGEPHPMLGQRLAMMSRLRWQRGAVGEAEGLLLEALEADKVLHGDHALQVALRYAELGRFYLKVGRTDEALGWLEPACSLLRSLIGDADSRTVAAVEAHASLVVQRATAAPSARDGAVLDLVEHGLALAQEVLGADHPQTRALRRMRSTLR